MEPLRIAMTSPPSDRLSTAAVPQAGRAELADAGRPPAGRRRPSGPGGRRSRSSCSGCDGGPSQLETFDPHPGTQIAGGTGAIATAVKGVQLAEGFEHLAEADGLGRPGPFDGQQGGRPRARHVHDEDRLPARPDGRCIPRSGRSAATSCRWAAPTSPGTSPSCPSSGRAAAASSATSTTPSRPATRAASCPT